MATTFRLSKKSNSTEKGIDLYEVMARFHVGSIDQYARTGIYVPQKFTDKNGNTKVCFKDGCVTMPKISYADPVQLWIKDTLAAAKARMEEISDKINMEFDKLRMAGKQPAKGWLDGLLNGVPEDACTVNEALDIYVNSDRNRLAQGSLKRFVTIKGIFERYEAEKGVTLTLDGLTPDILQDFVTFMRNEKMEVKRDGKIVTVDCKRSENYVTTTLRSLRTFIRWANGLSKNFPIKALTNNNPFENFAIGTELYGTPFYLTIEERNLLADFDLPPHLAVQRDIFIFQCLIGCRVSDLLSMTKKDIIDGAVEYIPDKTITENPRRVRVPLNSRAIAIIERYKDNGSGKLLPFISVQKYNDDIKEMLKLAGITRMVTIIDQKTRKEVKKPINEIASSHMARRTFIGNLYKMVKDPNLVGKLSGHKEGSKAFARYRDIDEDMAKELVSMLE